MSIFRNQTVACPSCGSDVSFEVVFSVNADRRPDLRDEIIARRFQEETCGQCKTAFRLEPQLTYYDLRRGQWLAVQPITEKGNWAAREQECREIYEQAYGEKASDAARALGEGITPRLVFGWAAFREKLIVAEAGLDDRCLERLKLALLRCLPRLPWGQTAELRLVEVKGGKLALAWIEAWKDAAVEVLEVDRALYDQMADTRGAWAGLMSESEAAFYVDMERQIFAQAA